MSNEVNLPPLLSSKKFWAALIASASTVASQRFGLSTAEIAAITGPLYAYIVAQGVADHGKERAKCEGINAMIVKENK